MEVSGIDDYKVPTRAFLQLQGNKSRQKALQELMKALPRQQLRDLLSMAAEVDFHCDLIAQLPFEINQMIFQQLSLRQIFQARRVSKAWRDALTDAGLVNSFLRSWYPAPHDPAPNLSGLSAERVASLNAEHVDAYKRGKAFSMRTHCGPSSDQGLEPDSLTYADGLLAWQDRSDHSICKTLDVRTGDTMSFIPEDRSQIYYLALSSSLVAVTTESGRCYLWKLKDQNNVSLKSLRLPSPWVWKFLVTKETVVVVFQRESGVHRFEGVTWTLSNQKTLSFAYHMRLAEENCHGVEIMLDHEGTSILFCERHRTDVPEGVQCVYFTRSSLDGIIRAQGMAKGPCISRSWIHAHMPNSPLTEVNQHATIWAQVEDYSVSKASTKVVRVRYDFGRDRIVYDTDTIKGNVGEEPQMFFYKQVAYYPFCQTSNPMLAVIDFDGLTCSQAPMCSLISWNDYWPNGEPENPEDDEWNYLFGDENLLVHVFSGGMIVSNFDIGCEMIKENVVYRTARQTKLQPIATEQV